MKEYRIVMQAGNATPYTDYQYYKTFEQCYFYLLRHIDCKCRSGTKPYYVENDFYDNKYEPYLSDIFKFRIEERDVDDWVIYEKIKNTKKINENKKKFKKVDNVYYLKNVN